MSFNRLKNWGLATMVAIMIGVSFLTHLSLTPVSHNNIDNIRNMQSMQVVFITYSEFQQISFLFEKQLRKEEYDFSKIRQSVNKLIEKLRVQKTHVGENAQREKELFENLIRTARFFRMSIKNYQLEASIDPSADNTHQMAKIAHLAQESFSRNYRDLIAIIRQKDIALHEQIVKSLAQNQKISLLGLLLSFTVSVIIALWLAKALKKPLQQLAEGTEKVAEGDLDFQFEVNNDDEIGNLAHSFNRMTNRLRNTMVSKSYLDNILHSMVDSLLVLDRQEKINRVNQATVDLLGYKTEDELMGMDIQRILCSGTPGPHASPKGTEVIRNVEKLYCSASGEKIPVLFSSSSLLDNDNQVIGLVCVAKDDRERKAIVEQQKLLKQDLLQKKKMEAIGTLAGGIAHDFNNLLAVICGYSQLFKLKLPKDSDMGKDVDEILNAGKRATELVKQILAFSRKSEHKMEYVQPPNIVKEVLQMLRSSIPATVSIREDIDEDCGYIQADPGKLHQIVMNLCTNAFHAMENEKGVLTVALHQREVGVKEITSDRAAPGPHIILTVSDTGCGMDTQTIEKIFEPFFTTKQVGKGTGLGLAVIHGMIEDYRGFIKVESVPGKGTSFDIFLPAYDRGFTPPAKPLPEKRMLRGSEHVLVVDDEPSIVDMHQMTLEHLGYKVSATIKSSVAMEMIRKDPGRFDLLITDQTMPEMTGAELAQKVLALKPEMPIILCTGYSALLSKEASEVLGIARYIEKPVSVEELSLVVRQVLDEQLDA